MKHQSKTNRPPGVSKKSVRKLLAIVRKAEKLQASQCDVTAGARLGWFIDFLAQVPETPLLAAYAWGPYESELDARIDAQLVTAEKVEVKQHPASDEDWRFPNYPHG